MYNNTTSLTTHLLPPTQDITIVYRHDVRFRVTLPEQSSTLTTMSKHTCGWSNRKVLPVSIQRFR